MKNYLEHHFPIVLHSAIPLRLDDDLRKKLNVFLPTYRNALEEIVVLKGKNKMEYRLFKPHDMAIILLPEKFIIALCQNNSSIFLTGLYCFELNTDADKATIEYILENSFNMENSYLYEFDSSFLCDEYNKNN